MGATDGKSLGQLGRTSGGGVVAGAGAGVLGESPTSVVAGPSTRPLSPQPLGARELGTRST